MQKAGRFIFIAALTTAQFLLMHLQYHIPAHGPLSEYVCSIWELEGESDIQEHILPQGVVEIVFSFADEVHGQLPNSDRFVKSSCCFIQGIHTQPMTARYKGRHHLFGLRLHPHCLRDWLGLNSADLVNNSIDLCLIDPGFNSLWHQLYEQDSFTKRVQLLEMNLPLIRLSPGDRSRHLSSLFLGTGNNRLHSVDILAREMCYSTRQLNRISHQLFGLSAEEITMYKRYMEALKQIHQSGSSLTGIAYECGFYDQAHFTRTFKTYTTLTPGQYRKQMSGLPFHLFV